MLKTKEHPSGKQLRFPLPQLFFVSTPWECSNVRAGSELFHGGENSPRMLCEVGKLRKIVWRLTVVVSRHYYTQTAVNSYGKL